MSLRKVDVDEKTNNISLNDSDGVVFNPSLHGVKDKDKFRVPSGTNPNNEGYQVEASASSFSSDHKITDYLIKG